MSKLTSVITTITEKILIVLMASIVIDVVWQIVSRFIVGKPSSFTEELAGFLLMWIGLLGGSYAYFKKAHLGIDIFMLRLSATRKIQFDIIISLLVLLFSIAVLIAGGIRLVYISFALHQISPALKLSMGFVYLVVPLSGFLMMYHACNNIVKDVQHLKTPGK